MLYEHLIRPMLFGLSDDPEDAHDMALKALDRLSRLPSVCARIRELVTPPDDRLQKRVAGISFPNPIGLAAGFAKKPIGLHGLAALGFGFIELGTITPLPQKGNDRPRIFRLEADHALINRMGFNNPGSRDTARMLQQMDPLPIPLGINIGKGKDTPLEEAAEDYADCIEQLNLFADYFVVNVSSPNTVGLRMLQNKAQLREILRAVLAERRVRVEEMREPHRPIFVKLTVDLGEEGIVEAVDLCLELGIDGVIVSNTTVSRERLLTDTNEAGGLSGPTLHQRAVRTVARIRGLDSKIAIIGVGGISRPEDITRMRDAGADLFQIYTGLIYKGPFLPSRLVRSLRD